MRRAVVGVVIVGLLVVFLAVGCSRQAEQKTADRGPKEVNGVLLPDWAPENPSEAFLRAAKVLKPLPDEFPDYTLLLRACYEFFGTLTDEQIADFLQPKQRSIPLETAEMNEGMREQLEKKPGVELVGGKFVFKVRELALPVKSLTPPQRAAFENLLAAWGKEHVGAPDENLLVRWYKMGAKEDLSNVTIDFGTEGHMVNLGYRVHISISATEGRSRGGGISFAQL